MRLRSRSSKAVRWQLRGSGNPGRSETKVARIRGAEAQVIKGVTNVENGTTFRTNVQWRKEIKRRNPRRRSRNKKTTRKRGEQKTSQSSRIHVASGDSLLKPGPTPQLSERAVPSSFPDLSTSPSGFLNCKHHEQPFT